MEKKPQIFTKLHGDMLPISYDRIIFFNPILLFVVLTDLKAFNLLPFKPFRTRALAAPPSASA